MNELIKVTYDNDRPVVSARELHDFLEVETPYRIWFPRMQEYGFTEGTDFNPYKNVRVQMEGNRTVNREVDDAALSIDMAKEICMIQRSEKGNLMPYADKNNGLFELKECYNEKTEWKGTQTMVTPKGRETFRLLCQGMQAGKETT